MGKNAGKNPHYPALYLQGDKMMKRKKYRYPYVMIRCKNSTKEEWRRLLEHFRKCGLKGEDLLLLGMKCIKERWL